MVKQLGDVVAVRVIRDDQAPECTAAQFDRLLFDAIDADRTAAQDAYLTALTTAAEIPPEELVRLRDAVRAGQTGGASDGAQVRRSRVRKAST